MHAAPLVLNHLQHVGIPVTDIMKSQEFYKKLGFENVMEAPFKEQSEKGICVMMQHGTVIIELYQLPDKFLNAIADREDGHIDHIAFDVPDIDAAFRWINEAGFQTLEPEPVFLHFWKKGCRYFNIIGPDQERLEFNQILK